MKNLFIFPDKNLNYFEIKKQEKLLTTFKTACFLFLKTTLIIIESKSVKLMQGTINKLTLIIMIIINYLVNILERGIFSNHKSIFLD